MTIPTDSHSPEDGTLLVVQAGTNHGVAADTTGDLTGFHFRRRTGRPLPGDHITLDHAGALERILPRRNSFGRGDGRGRRKAIAANLDQVLIVLAPEPAPSRDLLHRYLAAALIEGIRPLIVVNKADLSIPDQPPFSHLDELAGLGYDHIRVHCFPQANPGDLPERLSGRLSLLAGQSGVGKSSLLNALVPDLEIQTRALSRVTGKGTHTTTSVTLHRLPHAGWAMDTPGVWEYTLWAMDYTTLEKGFPEFSPHARNCRFRDCRHQHEPDCAVKRAVDAGGIPDFRHRAWLRLLAEQERLGSKA